MTDDTDEPTYRQFYRARASDATARLVDDESEDGMMTIRMPIASTGEVRNEGDDPLTRDEIDGMAQQLGERQIGVFPGHGRDGTIASGRYSPFEKLGYWEDATVEEREVERDGTRDTVELLMADAAMPDPDTLPNLGAYREGLGILKEQAKRGIAQDASIGWRDDDSFPGGVDLMEASIVGIGADWRTNTATESAMARAAVAAGADPDAFVDEVRAAVMGATPEPDKRHLSEQQAEMARAMADAYREAQGDGSVENFEAWLFNVAFYEFDEDQFHAAMTALQEWYRETTPLDEPVSERFLPFLDARQTGESTNDMTDTETDESDEQSADTDDDSTERQEAPEWAADLRELLESMNETLGDVAEAVRQEDDDEDDDDEEDNETDEDEDGDEENSQDADVTADQREALDTLRDGGFNVDDLDLPEPDDEQDADDAEGEAAAPAEDDFKKRLR